MLLLPISVSNFLRNVLYSVNYISSHAWWALFFWSLRMYLLQMFCRLIKISERLTLSYKANPETCHGVSSVGYRERFQKRLCNIAKQGFAVEITCPIDLRSMLMGQGRFSPPGKCFCHTALNGISSPESKQNCADHNLFNCYLNCERKLYFQLIAKQNQIIYFA